MLTQTSNFLDDSTGIEKTLRLAQGLCTVLAGLATTSAAAAPWASAKSQINLGRRYLRLHKWHQCFRVAYNHSIRSDVPGLEKLLEVAKWSFLGLYFLLEMPTLTNAMGITSYDWGTWLQNEALKCWFYGIAASLMLGYYQLLVLYISPPRAPTPTSTADEKAKKDVAPTTHSDTSRGPTDATAFSAARSRITTQLVIDHCDIFLPGSAVGWLPASPAGVGTCQSISSLLAMQQVWEKVRSASSK